MLSMDPSDNTEVLDGVLNKSGDGWGLDVPPHQGKQMLGGWGLDLPPA